MSRTVTPIAIAAVLILAAWTASLDGGGSQKKQGVEAVEFNVPPNLSVGRLGRLYVADTTIFRVQVFDRAGTPLKSIGRKETVLRGLKRTGLRIPEGSNAREAVTTRSPNGRAGMWRSL